LEHAKWTGSMFGICMVILSSPSSLLLLVLLTPHLHIYTYIYIYNILLNTLPKTFIVRVDFRPGGQLERQWTGIDVEEEYDGVGFVATTAWPGYR
jgi:hypothetical protein